MSVALGSGATILAVVLALWQINAQARRSEERLVQLLNVSIIRLDDKIGALDGKVNMLGQHLGEKIDALAQRLDQRLDATRELLQNDARRVEQLTDTRLKTLEKKL